MFNFGRININPSREQIEALNGRFIEHSREAHPRSNLVVGLPASRQNCKSNKLHRHFKRLISLQIATVAMTSPWSLSGRQFPVTPD